MALWRSDRQAAHNRKSKVDQIETLLFGERMNKQVKVQDERHQAKQKCKACVRGADDEPLAWFSPRTRFPNQEDHVTTIKHRNW